MKRAAFWVFLFLAGMGFSLVIDATLGALWVSLGWRKPIADRLLDSGVPSTIVAYWSLVWVNVPRWLGLVILGAFIGRRVEAGSWLRYALILGSGFIASSLLHSVTYLLDLAESDRSLTVGTLWRVHVWDMVSLVLLVLATWLFSRTRKIPPQARAPAAAES